MSATIRRLIATAGLVFGLGALAGTVFFYWQSLLDESEPVRAPISNSELKAAGGFGVAWQVPAAMRAGRWHRTGVRVWELGRALPLRVEEASLVTQQGQGRFCVAGEQLWFSAADNSSPLTNARNYEFEVGRPLLRAPILAWVLLAMGVGSLTWTTGRAGGLQRLWAWLRSLVWLALSQEVAARTRASRAAGIVLLSLAAACAIAALSGLSREVPIPATAIVQKSEGYFCYYLPRWIRRYDFRVRSAVLAEDRKALTRVAAGVLSQERSRGSFVSESGCVCFQPSDSSAPSVNRHTYRLRVFFFSPALTLGWGLFFSSLGLLMVGQARRLGGPARDLPARWASWWLPVLVVALGKLWVVAGEEPTATEFDPLSYASSAVNMIWGEGASLPTHTAGFPLLAGIVAQFGLPWRMALELLYLSACSYTALAVVALAGSRLTGLLAFILTAWHPWTLAAFGDFLSDPLVGVFLVVLLGVMFRLLNQPAAEWRWSAFLLIGGLLFLWDWSRLETPLVYASYGLFVALALVAARSHASWTGKGRRRAGLLLTAPLVMVFGLSSFVKAINYQRFGIHAKCVISAPGITALMSALFRVRPEEEVRYSPVTRQSLRAACEASPTLKPFEEALLDAKALESPELAEFLIWILQGTLSGQQPEGNARMLQAAREIETALREGKLPRRRAWYPLNPNWRLWLPDYPRACLRCLKQGISMARGGEPWGTWRQPILQQTFDLAASRRAASIHPCMLLAEGKVEAPPGLFDSVALGNEQGQWLGASPIMVSSNGWEHGRFGLRAPVQDPPAACRLVFFQQGKPLHAVELKLPPLAQGVEADGGTRTAVKRESELVLPGTGEKFSYSVKARLAKSAKKGRRESAEKLLAGDYLWLLWCSLGIVFVRSCCGEGWERSRLRAGALCVLLAAGWFVGRAALYGLMGSSFLSSLPDRYMRCVSPCFLLLLFLTTVVAAAFIGNKLRRNPGPRPNPAGTNFEPR